MKQRKLIILIFTCLLAFILPAYPSVDVLGEEEPPYAKWGRMAMKATKEKYPEADIVDYLHIGRERKGEQSIEKFKLWMRGAEREFGVFVDITFQTQSEEVISITFRETDR